ncbi:MAG: dTDP-glucose 4,6-dehydratase [Gemmatimonadota bacterium]|nr:MAG: dTDP-glucose 4,6-dehydratase [Gemmatimonadota bacterium]
MNLLITGGAGFIGSNFIRFVLRQRPECRITNLDKLTYAGNLLNLKDVEGDPRYSFRKGDIGDRTLVRSLFKGERFKAVVHFAAESHVDRSILDAAPFLETNVMGTRVLLEVVRQYPVEKFVQISTDEVYGSLGASGTFSEVSPVNPSSPYAASKAAADMLCQAYYRTYGVPVLIARSSNNYGPYQFPEKLIPLMIQNALTDKELPVYGEGNHVRDWLYVEDTCRAIDAILQQGKVGEIYNAGGKCERKNIDIVEIICILLEQKIGKRGLRAKIRFIEDPRGAAHDFRYALDNRKIEQTLGWRPQAEFNSSLERTIEWYLENRAWLNSVMTQEYLEYYENVYKSI